MKGRVTTPEKHGELSSIVTDVTTRQTPRNRHESIGHELAKRPVTID